MLERKVLLYVDSDSKYFNICKALTHLLFPFRYAYFGGLLYDLNSIDAPTSYCYGILDKQMEEEAILEALEELEEMDAEYVIFWQKKEGNARLRVYPPYSKLPKFINQLTTELTNMNMKFKTKEKTPNDDCLFSREVKHIFIKYIQQYILDGFDKAWKDLKQINIEEFSKAFLKINCKREINDRLFLKELLHGQQFAYLFDDACENITGEYHRYKLYLARIYIYIYILYR